MEFVVLHINEIVLIITTIVGWFAPSPLKSQRN